MSLFIPGASYSQAGPVYPDPYPQCGQGCQVASESTLSTYVDPFRIGCGNCPSGFCLTPPQIPGLPTYQYCSWEELLGAYRADADDDADPSNGFTDTILDGLVFDKLITVSNALTTSSLSTFPSNIHERFPHISTAMFAGFRYPQLFNPGAVMVLLHETGTGIGEIIAVGTAALGGASDVQQSTIATVNYDPAAPPRPRVAFNPVTGRHVVVWHELLSSGTTAVRATELVVTGPVFPGGPAQFNPMSYTFGSQTVNFVELALDALNPDVGFSTESVSPGSLGTVAFAYEVDGLSGRRVQVDRRDAGDISNFGAAAYSQVLPATGSQLAFPRLVWDPSKSIYHVVYVVFSPAGAGSDYSLEHVCLNNGTLTSRINVNGGSFFSRAQNFNLDLTADPGVPGVVDEALLVFDREKVPGGDRAILGLELSCEQLGDEFFIVNDQGVDAAAPDVASTPGGQVRVIYSDNSRCGLGSRVYVTPSTGGTKWSTQTPACIGP